MLLNPGWCQTRCSLHAWRKGMNGPQLAVGVLGETNTRVFRRCSSGNVPQRRRLFLVAIFASMRHFLKPYGLDTGTFAHQNSCTSANTVVFLPQALRLGTCKHYSVFKVLRIYSHTGAKKWKYTRHNG